MNAIKTNSQSQTGTEINTSQISRSTASLQYDTNGFKYATCQVRRKALKKEGAVPIQM